MSKREEILKYLSLEELEEKMQTKKTELKGLISTESCEFIIAQELGISEKSLKNEIKTAGECFEDALKRGYFDKGIYTHLDEEELEEIKTNIDSEELKREIEEYGKIDIYGEDIAFKDLEKALESDDTPEHILAFKKLQFWMFLRQIPIKTVDLYMYMGKNQSLRISFQHLAFKNRRFGSYIFIDEKRLDIDFEDLHDFVHKVGGYAK